MVVVAEISTVEAETETQTEIGERKPIRESRLSRRSTEELTFVLEDVR